MTVLLQERIIHNDDASASLLFVNGQFVCFIIEDEPREEKLAKETRIPAGHYKLKLRTFGGFNTRYHEKFNEMHKGMIEVADVAGFTDILLHVGNRESNTDGCLLTNMSVSIGDEIFGMASVEAYKKLYPMIIDSVIAGQATLTIVDRDNPFEETKK